MTAFKELTAVYNKTNVELVLIVFTEVNGCKNIMGESCIF